MGQTEEKERTEQECMDEVLKLFIERASKANEETVSGDQIDEKNFQFKCSKCKNPIHFGEQFVTISINREIHDDENTGDVLTSDTFFYFCLRCAYNMQWNTLDVSFTKNDEKELFQVERQGEEFFVSHVEPEIDERHFTITCNVCHNTIEQEEIYYCVPVHQEKIVDNEVHVLEAEVHLSFCSKCAERFDFSKIKVAFKQAEPETPINPMDYVKVVKWHWN